MAKKFLADSSKEGSSKGPPVAVKINRKEKHTPCTYYVLLSPLILLFFPSMVSVRTEKGGGECVGCHPIPSSFEWGRQISPGQGRTSPISRLPRMRGREREDSALSNADLVHEDVVAVVHPDAVKKLKLREGKEKRRGGGERSFCVNCPAEMPSLAGGTVLLSYGKGASITPELSVEVRGRRKKATSLTRERETRQGTCGAIEISTKTSKIRERRFF